jgi:hypothetical protein
MVATVRCEEIGNEKLASFTADEVIIVHIIRLNRCCIGSWNQLTLYIFIYDKKEWQQFEEAVQNDYVPGFGKKISSLLDRCLSE